MSLLAVNVGSSSLKLSLWEAAGAATPSLHLAARGVGAEQGRIDTGQGPPQVAALADHCTALDRLLGLLPDGLRVERAGHRLVHGGERFVDAVWIDESVLEAFEALVPLSPVHLPPALAVLRRARERLPAAAHAAVFDTAFHRTLPERARVFALPGAWRERGVRRYGFHGLACEDVVAQLGEALRPRCVILHLGAGCSATALQDGRSVDTSMGLTPLAGLVMATRSGDIDPGALIYLLRQGVSVEELDRGLNRDSGLRGLSGVSGDLQVLQARRDEPAVALALEVFGYQAAKAVGALAAALGGLDQLVFTGGIGEHAAGVRAAIGTRLGFLGVALDAQANAAGMACISAPGSAVRTQVVAVDEGRSIARQVAALPA